MSTLHSYLLLVRWNALRMKGFLPLAVVVQGLFAFGIVVGYPLLFPELDPRTVLFLATGAPAITLITMGLVAAPQVVAQARTEGSYEYMRSLPVPRVLHLFADLTVWLAIVVPGVVFAILLGAWRFSLDLQVSPLIVPALGLTTLTAASIGYGIASVLPPMVANLISQVLVVFTLMFSPLNFPSERLPDWLAGIHAVLPVQAMGEVIRGSLAPDTFGVTAGAFLLVGAWAAGSFLVAWRMMERRG